MKVNSLITALIFAFVCLVSFLIWNFSSRYTLSNISFEGVLFFLVPLALAFAFRQKFSEIGFSFEKKKEIVIYSAAMILIALPIMFYASHLAEFQKYYPQFFAGNFSVFLKFELLSIPSYFFLEFFYRGFALNLFRKYTNSDFAAVILQNIPYFLIHYGKPTTELYYSFFAGIILGYVCLRAKSFLPGFFSHYGTAVIFDYLNW